MRIRRGLILAATVLIVGLAIFPISRLTAVEETPFEYGAFVLDQQRLKLEYGETAVLTVKGGEANLEWSSGNPAIAEVDQGGRVKAVGPGLAVVTAKANGRSAVCAVEVTLTIHVDPDNVWLRSGASQQIQVGPIPEGESVFWSTGDWDIAEVDGEGNVTAVAPGKTQVTATVTGGTAHCFITVFQEIVAREQVVGKIGSPLPPKPMQSLLEDTNALHQWLIELERWRVDLWNLGSFGEIYEEASLAEIGLLSEEYFQEPILLANLYMEKVTLPEGVFYGREEYCGLPSTEVWLLLSQSKSVEIEVEEATLIISAEFEDDIAEVGPGSYTVVYNLHLLEDGSFRIGECNVSKGKDR